MVVIGLSREVFANIWSPVCIILFSLCPTQTQTIFSNLSCRYLWPQDHLLDGGIVEKCNV